MDGNRGIVCRVSKAFFKNSYGVKNSKQTKILYILSSTQEGHQPFDILIVV